MGTKYNRWEKFYNKLNMVFHGVIALSMIPFAWAFLETQSTFPEPPLFEGQLVQVIKWGLLVASLSVVLISYSYGRNLLIQARQLNGIEERLKAYINERLKDYLLLELASFLAFVGLYITKDHVFSVTYVAILVVFSFKRPTYDKVLKELDLKDLEVRSWIEEEQK